MGARRGIEKDERSASRVDPRPMRSQADMSLTETARRGTARDAHPVVSHVQNASSVGDPKADRHMFGLCMVHHVGQQLACHTEHDVPHRT